MKISKLFHWLYGCLMLLPIFSIGVSCLYTIFNDNAYLSYRGNYQYSSSAKYSEYIVDNNISVISYTNGDVTNYYYQSTNFSSFSINLPPNDRFEDTNVIALNTDKLILNGSEYSDIKSICIAYRYGNGGVFNVNTYDFVINTNYDLLRDNGRGVLSLNGTIQTPNHTIGVGRTEYLDLYCDLSINQIFTNNGISMNIFGKAYTILYLNDNSLSSVFYNSVTIINNAPLFSWASDSFLVQPIQYLTGIFGCPNDSPIITMLSYWLNISIIWLCFDLVMYVPLLCHRWIDKGMKE